jgi:glycine/D-amino acid oxidase-like deaminating enzyme
MAIRSRGQAPREVDALVVGGGFFGLCLALFLRSATRSILLVEAGGQLMERASRVNQARVHTGFHYPRSALTAGRSLVLHRRFARDFPQAIDDRFEMLYAVAARRSKVSAKRFFRMFTDMGAPIRTASPQALSLFDRQQIDGVFSCVEHAFDFRQLRRQLAGNLDAAGVDIMLETQAVAIEEKDGAARVTLSDGSEVVAKRVFDVTYSSINRLRQSAGLPLLSLKHEATEVALMTPPAELSGLGVTLMDGPFFSMMPFPSEGLYSLTHVRYTPGASWVDTPSSLDAGHRLVEPCASRARYMQQDAARYLPALAGSQWQRSLFEVKTVLRRSEGDDARPIVYRTDPGSRLVSILGGKLDNIYDLFDQVRRSEPQFAAANDSFISAGGGVMA